MNWFDQISTRMAEVPWVRPYFDEFRVDAMRYFHVDIAEMDGPTVMSLAYQFPNVVDIDYSVEPPRIMSAVFAAWRREMDAEAAESSDTAAVVTGASTGTVSMSAKAAEVQAARALEALDEGKAVEGTQYVGWNPVHGVPDGEVVTV